MSKAANTRNFGAGKNLTHFKTRENLANAVRAAENRGTAGRGKTISALGNLGEYLRANHGHRDLAKCTPEHMSGWAKHLRESGLSVSSTSSYISAINKVADLYGRKDLKLSAAAEGLGRGTKYSNEDLSVSPEERQFLCGWLQEKEQLTCDSRYEALSHSVGMQASEGGRLRESIRTSPKDNRIEDGKVHLTRSDGTKNGRARYARVLDPSAREAAAEFQSRHPEYSRSMIPDSMTQRQYLNWVQATMKVYALETGRKAPGFHGNRHLYAQERYAQEMQFRTGVRIDCPVRVTLYREDHIAHIADRAGISVDEARALDEAVRIEVSEDLGHSRLDVIRIYLGD